MIPRSMRRERSGGSSMEKSGEPSDEIAAKRAALDHRFERLVSGRDDAKRDLDGARRPHGDDLSLLQ